MSLIQTIGTWYDTDYLRDVPYWITQNFLYSQLDTLPDSLFRQEILGHSHEGRPIRLLQTGAGPTPVLIWSQMHGDEPTATRALLDLFAMFSRHRHDDIIESILNNLTLYIIPMLNPDGAERFTRRTATGIDMNRDALALRTPEGKILKKVCDAYAPAWAYSLHDQEPRYSTGGTKHAAAVSLLAAATSFEQTVDPVRRDAMRLGSCVASYVKELLPDNIAKYDDAYEPRAFGDNIMAWGIREILIESGYLPRDRSKETVRKCNTIALCGSLYNLATGTLPSTELYDALPVNRRYFAEHVFKNASITIDDTEAGNQDVAFHLIPSVDQGKNEVAFKLGLSELGDCSPYAASYVYDGSNIAIRFSPSDSSSAKLPEIDVPAECEISADGGGLRIKVAGGIPSASPEDVFQKCQI
jgi:hypothetical protein